MPRWLIGALALGAAVLHVALASRWSAEEHLGALVVGWGGTLALAYSRRHVLWTRASFDPVKALGAVLYVATLGVSISMRAQYHGVDRVLPVLAGLGLVLMTGTRLRMFACELPLLCATLVYPLPNVIKAHFPTLRPTTITAEMLLHLVRFPVERVGDVLYVPATTLTVFEGCSGKNAIGQLLLLALLVVCVFPETLRRIGFVAGSAVVIGFTVNAARVATLAVFASRDPDQFAYWDDYLRGAVLFPVFASVTAGLVWWAVLRKCQRAASSAGA